MIMKKLLSILVLGLLLSGNAYAEIIEYKECWTKNIIKLDHNFEKTEMIFKDNDYYKKKANVEFVRFTINAATNSLVRTKKYAKDNVVYSDQLKQI